MSSSSSAEVVGSAILLGVIVVGAVGIGIAKNSAQHTETCTVQSKDRTSNRNGGSDARIYTEDCGVFTVKDSLWAGTWHSSDTYAAIKPGHRYEFDVRGWRIPFFSSFPNIVDAKEVAK